MELDFSLTVIAIFVIIMLIMFARVTISYETTGEGAKPKPTVKRPSINSRNDTSKSISIDKTDKVMKNNASPPQYSAFGLPEKDAYMSSTFRNQIDSLKTKLYYDNCKYQLLEEFENNTSVDCDHPYVKIKYVS